MVSAKETDTEATAEKNEDVDQASEASALPEPSALASPERSMYDSGYTQVSSLFSREQIKPTDFAILAPEIPNL